MRKKKTGRRASVEERALAQNFVDVYRLAEESPEGSYCLNPESPPKDHEFVYANVDELLAFIEGFARNGTFEFIEQVEFDLEDLYFAIKDLRDKGLSYQESIATMAERHHKSARQIERELKIATENWLESMQYRSNQSEL